MKKCYHGTVIARGGKCTYQATVSIVAESLLQSEELAVMRTQDALAEKGKFHFSDVKMYLIDNEEFLRVASEHYAEILKSKQEAEELDI